MDTVLADVRKRAGVHERMLAKLHLDHMEAEGLDLPDQRLDRPVRRALGTRRRKRALHDAQVVQQLVSRGVQHVRVARDRSVQAVRHDKHDGAVRLGLRYVLRAARDDLAHLDLMVPEIEQLVGRFGVPRLEREVAPDAPALVRKLRDHVLVELRGNLTAHLGGNVGVAVAIRPNPASRMEKRRAYRRHDARALAEHPVVKATVDARHGVEQRMVEDVDDRVGFLDGRRLFDGHRRGTHESIDLLQHMALVFHEVRPAESRALGKQLADTANLALHGAAARLGRMRGKHRMELELAQQLRRTVNADLVDQLSEGDRQLVGRVHVRFDGHQALSVVQRLDTVVFLAQVGKVKKRRERAHERLERLDGKLVDQLHGGAKGAVAAVGGVGHALLVNPLVCRSGARIALVGVDSMAQQHVKQIADRGIVLLQHTALEAQDQREVRPQAFRDLDLGERACGHRRCRRLKLCLQGCTIGRWLLGFIRHPHTSPSSCKRRNHPPMIPAF